MVVGVAVYGLCLLSMVGLGQSVTNIACYYGTWARYSGLKPEHIDPHLCTSILVSFVQVSDDLLNIVPFDQGDIDQVYPVFRQMREVTNSGLKIVIALGGATHDDSKFDRMIANSATLRQFSQNTVLQLRQWGMDGIDVDWEFPSNKEIHLKFITALREAIDNENLQPGNKKLELSGALPAGSHYIAKYDIQAVGQIFDVAYIMAYDYHGPWDAETGHNSPLFPRKDDSNQLFNTEWTVNHWYKEGIPKSKLYVGLPTYGRTFILRNPTDYGVGAPANGGQLKTYGQSCSQILSKTNARKFWDPESEVPYAVEGSTWLSYANTASISNKCQWIDANGFGGAMVWSLHQDDFGNICQQGTFPLVRALKACSESFPTPATPPTLPTTAPPPTTTASGFCGGKPDNSFHEVPFDCSTYIQCFDQVAYVQKCAQGLQFTSQCNCCEFPSRSGRTDCDTMPTSTAAPIIQTEAPQTTTSKPPTTSSPVSTGSPRSTAGPITEIVEPLQKIACYYGTWARYSGLKADMIDVNLCTSILVSFVQVRDDLVDIRPFEPDDLSQVYPVLRNLKKLSTNGLKLIIALGGASHDNSRFDRMLADDNKLRQFASNTVKTIRNWGMDGIDVDWEFPRDAQQHVTFIAAMRAAIDGETLEAGQERLELSAALSAGSYIPNYDIPSIGSLLDIGYVMAYDYHGPWEKITGHNSPLFPRADDIDQNLNTEWSLNHWYLNGFPKEKLYVGVPTYGRQFGLTNPSNRGVGAPFSGGSLKTYREACSSFLLSPTTEQFWDSESKVPYAVDGAQWLSYANISSAASKCQWGSASGFGGLMVWSLHQDDYDGLCQQGTFPIIRALKACSESFPTPPPLPTTPAPPAPDGFCADKEDGFFSVSGNCEVFVQCANGINYIHNCPNGLHYRSSCTCCDFPSKAGRTDCNEPEDKLGTSTSSTSAPVTTSSSAPTTPSTAAPVTPSTAAPVTPSTAAPVTPSTEAPVTPSTEEPEIIITGGNRFGGRMEKIACYYGTWGRYSGLRPEGIDESLCTSVLVSFVQVSPDLTNIVPFDLEDIDMVYPVLVEKKRRSGMKLIIALGGASHANTRFDQMIANPATLETFARNTVKKIREWNMDGIDVDWEFPENKAEHVTFLTAMKKAIDEESRPAGLEKLELSAALPAGHYIANYDIPAVGQLLDIGYIMAYDYHGPWESMTGHNSPLFPRRSDENQKLNTEWTVNHWIENGLPKEKVYLGVPTYARTFRVADASLTGTGVGVRAWGQQTLTYRQVCNNILSKPSTLRFWDGESMVPYAVDGDIWVSYANGTSLAHKCYWADKQGLGGLMVWSLHQDDFDGSCDGIAFSLTTALKQCSGVLPTVVITTPGPTVATTTPMPTTTTTLPRPTGPVTDTFCSNRPGGFYEIPGDCEKFVRCVGGNTNFFSCSGGLHFDITCTCCQHPDETGRFDCNTAAEVPGGFTRAPTTTSEPDYNFCVGRADGSYEVAGDCSIYYVCSNERTFHGRCAYPTLYNSRCNCCDTIPQTLNLRRDCERRL